MHRPRPILASAYWTLTAGLFGVAVAVALFYAPTPVEAGPIQKLIYVHVPAAVSTLLACVVVFVASIGFAWQRKPGWDDLAAVAALVAVGSGAVVLLTGMVWARTAWHEWWTWSPLLTFSLVLWLVYAGYVVMRWSVRSAGRRAIASAFYGIVAFLDVPLIYLSVKLLPDRHPAGAQLDGPTLWTLGLWLVVTIMVCAGVIVVGFRARRRERLRGDPAMAGGPSVPIGGSVS